MFHGLHVLSKESRLLRLSVDAQSVCCLSVYYILYVQLLDLFFVCLCLCFWLCFVFFTKLTSCKLLLKCILTDTAMFWVRLMPRGQLFPWFYVKAQQGLLTRMCRSLLLRILHYWSRWMYTGVADTAASGHGQFTAGRCPRVSPLVHIYSGDGCVRWRSMRSLLISSACRHGLAAAALSQHGCAIFMVDILLIHSDREQSSVVETVSASARANTKPPGLLVRLS